MLTKLLVLASLPLRLLEMGVCAGKGMSNGLVGVACRGGGSGSTGRLVRGALEEGVLLEEEGVARNGIGRSRWRPLSIGEEVRKGGGGDRDILPSDGWVGGVGGGV